MFKNLVLAVIVAVSFGGAILTSATPAAAESPKEEVTFEYGALDIEYSLESPD